MLAYCLTVFAQRSNTIRCTEHILTHLYQWVIALIFIALARRWPRRSVGEEKIPVVAVVAVVAAGTAEEQAIAATENDFSYEAFIPDYNIPGMDKPG
ncbi:hypothetical protein [Methanoculleus methanifontis]|uniref:hypothetical protein n=1 Tax=Methanoculleus methanifontis TaxID=2584086 RepID=UPI00265801EF|nr:hypothetical protein [Methanoculleus sp. FWC-SCC3]